MLPDININIYKDRMLHNITNMIMYYWLKFRHYTRSFYPQIRPDPNLFFVKIAIKITVITRKRCHT